MKIGATVNVLISIHAPRTGSDYITSASGKSPKIFQSTLPARGATEGRKKKGVTQDISIHAPRTGSDETIRFLQSAPGISIHAPRTGSDPLHPNQSVARRISIHAPRTGSDCNPSDKVHTM